MDMEDRQNDAMIAAQRCLAAVAECEDGATARSLLRCAVRYGLKARRDALLRQMQRAEEGEARQEGIPAAPLARTAGGGLVSESARSEEG